VRSDERELAAEKRRQAGAKRRSQADTVNTWPGRFFLSLSEAEKKSKPLATRSGANVI
jgi:hypothetical protein